MPNTVLVAGASGLVGAAVVDRFLDDGWDVIAVSRRKPEVFSDKPFRHLTVDLQDEAAYKQAFSDIADVTHLVYTAVYESAGCGALRAAARGRCARRGVAVPGGGEPQLRRRGGVRRRGCLAGLRGRGR